MNLLAPLFLLGGLAIVGPVIFHLIRRTTRERAVFSSLMFLLPTPPRLSKRSRVEHLLLLALRCLALALLAFGFARPFFRETPPSTPAGATPKRIVVLVDTSASMRRAGLWAAARERVDHVLRRAAPIDEVALNTFDRQAVALLSFDEWNRTPAGERVAVASARLAAVNPGWASTHLGAALITAADAVAETAAKRAPGPREIVLVSDLQAGSRLDALQAYEWPKGVRLSVETVGASGTTNAGLQLLMDTADTPRTADAVVRVRVTNAPDARREQFQLGWARAGERGEAAASAAFVGAPIDVYVPPGQSRVATVPVPKVAQASSPAFPDAGGTPAPLDRIVLRGDDEDFDNTVFVLPPEPQRVNVLWLGAEPADDARQPLFFLRRAFGDTPRLAVKVTVLAPASPQLEVALRESPVVFVGGSLAPPETAALRARLDGGSTAVLVARSADSATTLAALAGRESVPLAEIKPDNYAMFGEIDFRHPLFAPFADPKFSDFTKIHFWRYRKLDLAALPGARAVARFDNGDPVVVEVPVGRGRLVVLTAGWHPEDSQLAVSSKFVPLLYALLEWTGAVQADAAPWTVGDALPNGTTATQPGIVALPGTGGARRLAVNLDPSESRTAPLSADELERLGVPVTQAAPEAPRAAGPAALLQAAEAEGRQKLWRWCLVAALVVLAFETALAGWTVRHAKPRPEEVIP